MQHRVAQRFLSSQRAIQLVSQPTYLKNLKEHARLRSGSIIDEAAWIANLKNESDRGAVILVSTTLEDLLEDMIFNRLPGIANDEPERKKLFEASGPLSTFAAKIDFAYALKIIDKEYQKRIHLIREIRNACAHSRTPISFKDEALREAAKAAMPHIVSNFPDESQKRIREGFIILCQTTLISIIHGKKYDTPDDHMELFKEHWQNPSA